MTGTSSLTFLRMPTTNSHLLRTLAIATTSHLHPLALSPADPICASLSTKYQPPIPPHSPTFAPTSARKVHIRTIVALASGHALSHIHSLHSHQPLKESYDEVDATISECIRLLIDKPQPHTWLHCDAIALAFCSHILLQKARVEYLTQVLAQEPPSTHLAEQEEKARLALTYSRRMAWDMVKVAISKIENEEEVKRLPFAGLCCVLRAGMAVLETNGCVEEDVV